MKEKDYMIGTNTFVKLSPNIFFSPNIPHFLCYLSVWQLVKAHCSLDNFWIEISKTQDLKETSSIDLRRVELSLENRKDFIGLRRRKTLHPGQRVPGPSFLHSLMKAIENQMGLGDTGVELKIHYSSIPVRSETATSAQMHQNGPHVLEQRF